MNRLCTTIALLLAGWLAAAAAWACNTGTVRDAAFLNRRDVHRLCVMANRDDAGADATFERLSNWIEKDGAGLNLEVERVIADDEAVFWENYGLPSAPPSVPVVALIGVFRAVRRTFVIDHWEPAPTDEDLAAILHSPARADAKKTLVDDWAVLLFAPGEDADAAAHADAVEAIEKKWDAEHPPGITVVYVDRADPDERILCSFAGIQAGGPDWAGVLFGRGRLMAPPLIGEDISEGSLDELLRGLTMPCTCLQEATALGLDVPMTWEPELDAKFAAMEAASGGYTEIALRGGAAAAVPTPAAQIAALAEEVPDTGNQAFVIAVSSLGAIALAASAATALLVWRSRRRNAVTLEN